MRNSVLAVPFALILGLSGCDRLRSKGSAGDDGSTAAAASGTETPAHASGKPTGELPLLAGFEGEIDLTAKGKTSTDPIPINLLVKNEQVRVDLPPDVLGAEQARAFTGGGKVYLLLKASEKKMTAVLEAKRSAVVINLDQAGEHMKSFRHGRGQPGGPDAPPSAPPKIVKTGTKETVAGYTCEDWDILNADKSKLSTCVADKGASFFHLPLSGLPTEHAWALELMDGKHFPLRGVSFDRDGAEVGRVEVTKLDPRSLEGSLFEVPQGYKVITMEEMMQQGLGGAIPPGELPPGVIPPGVPPHKGGSHGPHRHKKQ